MRVAVISDPHGDLVALRAVIADLEAKGVDEVLVAGDLAQGGPQPAETLDELRGKGWPSVRGNSHDFLVNVALDVDPALPATAAQLARAAWSVDQLGPERIEFLSALPLQINRGWAPNGGFAVVHATPWSTEEVVLPDATEEVAQRMLDEAGAALLAYGHIHTGYQRRLGGSVLLSAGAIYASNDADGRPAYTVLTLDEAISVEVVRVDCDPALRLPAYRRARLEYSSEALAGVGAPGPWPLRSGPGRLVLWP